MKLLTYRAIKTFLFFILLLISSANQAQKVDFSSITINQKDYYQEIDFEIVNDKIMLPVVINNKTYSFLLDTGAPNLISKRVLEDINSTKSKKIKVTNRFFNYFILDDVLGNTIIQKRTAKGIWHNLYEFPLLETDKIVDFDVVSKAVTDTVFASYTIIGIEDYPESTVIHKLSHQHLHIQFWKVKIEGLIENGLKASELNVFPFPIVIHNFIESE